MPQLTRDQRLQCLTLRDIGWSYERIAVYLDITQRQVQTAVEAGHPTPSRRTGRPQLLSSDQVDELVTYITSTQEGRRMSWLALAKGPFSHWNVSEYAIRYALRQRGYRRCVALAKPPLSEDNARIRLQWANEHLGWTKEQWAQILWTDETWVTGGHHRKKWITRKPGEELDPTCVVEKVRRRAGWMFWGSFSLGLKGPHLFWEKDWGTINKESYCQHTVPVIHGWLRLNPTLRLMQDGAPGYRAGETIEELRERDIEPIFWPAFSPDLNPIETVWNWMKQWIEEIYGDISFSNYDRLREAVLAAWEAIPQSRLDDLIDSMSDRCQAVIDAGGYHTKY